MSDKIIIRAIKPDDVERGLIETLESLSPVQATPEQLRRQLARRQGGGFALVAVHPTEGIVGTLSAWVHLRLIHGCGRMLYVEDVAVRPSWQGKGIGRLLLQKAFCAAREYGCYKVVLYCGEDKAGFYERVGMRSTGLLMELDIDLPD